MHQNDLPKVIESKVLIEAGFFKLRCDKLALQRENYDYYCLEAPPFSVMVLATDSQNRFVLNWEYRHPVKQFLLSCPGGILEGEESPLNCAKRELYEETGFKAEDYKIIGESYPFPGICTQKVIYVRAYNAQKVGPAQCESSEFIETELFSQQQLQKALEASTLVDGLLLTCLFFNSQVSSRN